MEAKVDKIQQAAQQLRGRRIVVTGDNVLAVDNVKSFLDQALARVTSGSVGRVMYETQAADQDAVIICTPLSEYTDDPEAFLQWIDQAREAAPFVVHFGSTLQMDQLLENRAGSDPKWTPLVSNEGSRTDFVELFKVLAKRL